ncbi:hypothetical protein B0G81_0928 [Paraburkholderia sp. BL6665CI2N2]|nr:hypothetical protein B0G81_0928 [Paraburkholderia sp. BL6665CI2N2]
MGLSLDIVVGVAECHDAIIPSIAVPAAAMPVHTA